MFTTTICCYPATLMATGPVDVSEFEKSTDQLTGIYLLYAYAQASMTGRSLIIEFSPGGHPAAVKIPTANGSALFSPNATEHEMREMVRSELGESVFLLGLKLD
ncbi:hypothetical protein [Stenotrophomonas hibiscicola]|uniref:hypothetical protein n=1 Tax=Stenotrophomonas hibiscicola TaxID=86189 RepID=UPI003D144BA1